MRLPARVDLGLRCRLRFVTKSIAMIAFDPARGTDGKHACDPGFPGLGTVSDGARSIPLNRRIEMTRQ